MPQVQTANRQLVDPQPAPTALEEDVLIIERLQGAKKGAEAGLLMAADAASEHWDSHPVILAAETGHLVLSTLHTLDATESIHRIITVFPSHQQQQPGNQIHPGMTQMHRGSSQSRNGHVMPMQQTQLPQLLT